MIGGIVLVLVGVLGFVGVIGPTQEESIFNKVGINWWFDVPENWAHLILGIVALIAAFALPAGAQRPLVMLLGIVGVLVALWNIYSTNLLGANLENPADMLLHLVVGLWALASSWKKPAPAMMGGMPGGM
jgi:hypothetical protein